MKKLTFRKFQPADASRPLPFSEDAEKGVLSCIMQIPERLIEEARETIPAEAFNHPGHRDIYSEMIAVGSKQDGHLDLITLTQHLMDRRMLDNVGGPGYLAEIFSMIPAPNHFPIYRSILIDKLLLRRAIHAGNDVVAAAYELQDDPDKVADIMAEGVRSVEEQLRARKGQKTWSQKTDELAELWSNRYLGRIKSAIPSPWGSWNRTIGGFRTGYELVLGAKKTGKSSLVGHKALHLSVIAPKEDRVKSIIFTYETKVEDYTMRLVSALSGVRGSCIFEPDLDPPNDHERRSIARAFTEIAVAPLEVINGTGMTVYDIERAAKRFGAWFVGVDYLMLLPWLPDANQKEGTEGRVRTNSNALIGMSRNLDACVDVINHTVSAGDRQGESRWSDQPENDCDICLLVDKKGITVKSRRNGRSGDVMPIRFRGETYSFVEEYSQSTER